MPTAYKVLGQVVPTATTLTTLYTVPSATQAVISSVVITNQSATSTSFRVSIAVAGAADTPKQYVAYDVPVFGNDVVSLALGLTLGAGDVIRVYATLATVSFSAFGEEIS